MMKSKVLAPVVRRLDNAVHDIINLSIYFYFMKIHTRLWHCGTTVTCNCGVAIRELSDVIVISACSEDLQYYHGMPTKVLITSPGRLTRGTKILVRQNGQFSEYVVRGNLVTRGMFFRDC